MLDQLVVLGTQERQLRQPAVRVENAQIGVLVADERRTIFAALDVNPRPRGQLVGYFVDECFRPGHLPIVSPLTRIRSMSDESIAGRIESLVSEEHKLRSREEQDSMSAEALEADQQRLWEVEIELDRCWDLLRQRRALRDAGADPEQARVRDADTVERYQQ